jgi:hypothetical protein
MEVDPALAATTSFSARRRPAARFIATLLEVEKILRSRRWAHLRPRR